jgi:predicted ATP-binding protein involved in virulence
MYLGLERKAGSTNRRYPRLPNRDSRAAVFSSSLEASLNDASSFAAAAYRKAYIAESKLKDELRNDLILVSFAFEDISKSLNFSKKLPSKSDATKSVSKHRNIIDVLSKIGLEGGEFKKSIENFFSELTKIIQDLPDIPKSKKITDLAATDMNKVFRYEFNKLQFDRANAIASRVEKFSEEVKKIYESIEAFKTLMNEFFSPSQKSVFVDVNGLSVNIANVGPRDLTSLSSGEQQLVVLLTQLWFNPSAISSNILIIDEPELSLHLRWQEMFVSALLTAHSGLQLILATHSPSIILDRDDKAKELVPQYA